MYSSLDSNVDGACGEVDKVTNGGDDEGNRKVGRLACDIVDDLGECVVDRGDRSHDVAGD